MKLNIKSTGEANKIALKKVGVKRFLLSIRKSQIVPKTAIMGSFGKINYCPRPSSYINFQMSSASVIKSLFRNICSAILGKIMGLIAPKYHLECRVHDKGVYNFTWASVAWQKLEIKYQKLHLDCCFLQIIDSKS